MQTTEIAEKKNESAVDLLRSSRHVGLAAVSIRQYRRAVNAARLQPAVEMACRSSQERMGATMHRKHVDDEAPGVIDFGSRPWACPASHEQNSTYAQEYIKTTGVKKGKTAMYLISERAWRITSRRRSARGGALTTPATTAGITPCSRKCNHDHLRINSAQHRITLFVFTPSTRPERRTIPACLQLLPVETDWHRQIAKKNWDSNRLPDLPDGRDRIFSSLILGNLFVSLYRGFCRVLVQRGASRCFPCRTPRRKRRALQGSARQSTAPAKLRSPRTSDNVAGFEALCEEASYVFFESGYDVCRRIGQENCVH